MTATGIAAGTATALEDRIRVATLNVWGRRGDWPARRRVLTDGFADLRPDLVAFQEVIEDERGDEGQVAEILGAGYQFAQQGRREPDGQGISIASRWPIRQVHEVDLHVTARTAGVACGTLVAEVEAPEPFGPLLFVNHFPSWQLNLEHERELQAVTAARFIHGFAEGRHVIVAGDFDADPGAASVRFWVGRQSLDELSVCYRDAWESRHGDEPGHTFVPDNPLGEDWDWPFRRIDYVLVRCGQHGGPTLAVRDCRRIFDQAVDGTWASDHFGVCADLSLPPGPRGE